MASPSSTISFCSSCGFGLENNFMFCPNCGVKIRHSSESTTAPVTRPSAAPGLPNFQAFKSKKESERRSFFSSGKGKGQEREKVEEEMVAISVGVMKDVDTVKRRNIVLKGSFNSNHKTHN